MSYTDQILVHYGILGMHWGIRRYQPYGKGGYLPKKQKANNIYSVAKVKEPRITKDVVETISHSGGKPYGLENRLKTLSSIERKINKKSSDDIKDAVRYTMITPDKDFVSGYKKFKSEMKDKGYEELRCKNNFVLYQEGKVKHKSVQSTFADKDGYVFEMQFQTPGSQKAKDLKVPIYEERRRIDDNSERARILEDQMVKLAEEVGMPKDIEQIKSYDRIRR